MQQWCLHEEPVCTGEAEHAWWADVVGAVACSCLLTAGWIATGIACGHTAAARGPAGVMLQRQQRKQRSK